MSTHFFIFCSKKENGAGTVLHFLIFYFLFSYFLILTFCLLLHAPYTLLPEESILYALT